MPKCKNDPKRTYKETEPSPKGFGYCAHSEKLATKKKGRDKRMWIVTKTKAGVKRWTKVKINNNKEDKLDCSKFVTYTKKVKKSYGTVGKSIGGIEKEKGL